MIFGNSQHFAIEATAPVGGLSSVRVWVNRVPFGNFEQRGVLKSLQLDAARFLSLKRRRLGADSGTPNRHAVRAWYRELVERCPEEEAKAEALDLLIETIQLFAFAPEGLSAVRVVVEDGAGDSCLVTAWEEGAEHIEQAEVSEADLRGTIEKFAEWNVPHH